MGRTRKKGKSKILHVTKILDFIFSLTPVKLSERQRKNQMVDFGNVQNPPFAFFRCRSATKACSRSRFDKLSDQKMQIQRLDEAGSARRNYSSVTKRCLPGARVLVSRELSGPGMRAVAVVPAGISTVHSNLSPVRFQLLTIFP